MGLLGLLAGAVMLLGCGGGTSAKTGGPQNTVTLRSNGESAEVNARGSSLWDAMTEWLRPEAFQEGAWWLDDDVRNALRSIRVADYEPGRPTDWDISREAWRTACGDLRMDWSDVEALRRFHACVGQRFALAIVQRSSTSNRQTIEAELSAQIGAMDHGTSIGAAPLLVAPKSLRGYIDDESTHRLTGALQDRRPTHLELAAALACGASIGDWIVNACPPGIDDDFDPGFHPPRNWSAMHARALPLAPAYALAAGVPLSEVESLTQGCFFHRAQTAAAPAATRSVVETKSRGAGKLLDAYEDRP